MLGDLMHPDWRDPSKIPALSTTMSEGGLGKQNFCNSPIARRMCKPHTSPSKGRVSTA
jgi:hypothetical protein